MTREEQNDWLCRLRDDCIDRKELDKALYERFHEEDSPNNITDVPLGAVRNFIKNFPSATPQEPKTGHWIKSSDVSINQRLQIIHEYICSECSGISYFRGMNEKLIGAKFCPSCGAKMVEPQERSEE